MSPANLKKTISRLDLLSLRLFLTICEEQSIGRAAERENIASSAVTKRVQELEHLFGVQLFYRTARGTVPSPVGEALAARAREIFGLVEVIRTEISEYAEGSKGHVRLAAIPSAIVGTVARDLRRFWELHPMIDLDVREQLSSDVVHSVATGTADLGLYASWIANDSEVESFLYRQDELMLLCPVGHPLLDRRSVGMADIMDADLVGVHENSSVMAQLRGAASGLGRTLSPRFQVHSNEVARAMVEAGFGVTVLPSGLTVQSRPEIARSVPIAEDWARRELRLCCRRDAVLPAQTRSLLDFLMERRA